MLINDISQQPGAFRAMKTAVPVLVRFAESDDVLQTLEGPVRYRRGDALLTGIHNESWPVPRERFEATYEPIQNDKQRRYSKRPIPVWALPVKKPMNIVLSDDRGTLHAKPGDLLIQSQPGDVYVVAPEIFARTYIRLP
jgi:hypothetical protein